MEEKALLMSTEIAPYYPPELPRVLHAEDDDHLIELWLNSKSSLRTREEYARDIVRFQLFVDKPLRSVKLGDCQAYAADLAQEDLSSGSRRRMLASVKSV